MYWLKISHSKAKMELSPQRAKLEATGNVNRIRNSEHHSLCIPGPPPFTRLLWRSYMGGKRKTSIHSHSSTGGHIWEENGRLQSILIQAPEVIYGRKRKTSIHSHSSAGGHIWEGNGGLRSILTQALEVIYGRKRRTSIHSHSSAILFI